MDEGGGTCHMDEEGVPATWMRGYRAHEIRTAMLFRLVLSLNKALPFKKRHVQCDLHLSAP